MEKNEKHLEFIQSIITRMNTNSFQIKGLTITIVSALMAVYASTQKMSFMVIAIFPTIIFWFLDTYYLQQERKFIGVYNDVAGITKENKVEIKPFEMPIKNYYEGKYSFSDVFFSKTIVWFYLSIVFLLSISAMIIHIKDHCIRTNCHF